MCEATAYVLKDGREELLLENVDFLENRGDQVKMLSLFGEEIVFKGHIKNLSLLDHKILLEAG
ncbi:MAG: CooT family nickel-binding protein [Desulfatiglandaceae bacterium]